MKVARRNDSVIAKKIPQDGSTGNRALSTTFTGAMHDRVAAAPKLNSEIECVPRETNVRQLFSCGFTLVAFDIVEPSSTSPKVSRIEQNTAVKKVSWIF